MKNRCDIHSDGICIYIETRVGAKLIGKVIMIIFNILGWTLFLTACILIPGEELGEFIIPLGGWLIILIFVIGRFSAWNFWGKERIRVNTKSISYNRSYGLIETNVKIIKISRLGLSYQKVRFLDDAEHGKIVFFNYDENNNPINVFETTILMRKEKIDEIFNLINEIFKNEMYEKYNIVPFTEN